MASLRALRSFLRHGESTRYTQLSHSMNISSGWIKESNNPSRDGHKVNLWERYDYAKKAAEGIPLSGHRDATAVFCNNELNLDDIDVYGFDYDYTLASYKPTLHYIIYNMGCQSLVKDYNYPSEMLKFDYDPDFSVRGLHCDVKKGPNMFQLMDLFAVPEMTLCSNVIHYFLENDITYDPEYVFYDVRSAIQGLHSSGVLHHEIIKNMGVFLSSNTGVADLLYGLSAAGKKLFLITNSSVSFISRGMKFLVGDNWADLFDVIITRARKPKFFYDSQRPFRQFDVAQETKTWDRVTEFIKGQPYEEGNLYQLQELTGWYGSRVLYFGDHVYSDLADATLKHGWRTGAIIPELEAEIHTMNSTAYKSAIRWLITLEKLIQDLQVYQDPESLSALKEWRTERNSLRVVTKNLFNKQFGSVFRTFHNPTYFTRRLNRFADLYTSSVNNLLKYPLNYTFFPRRSPLPHEERNLVSDYHQSDTKNVVH